MSILAVAFLLLFTYQNVNAQCGATSVTADPQPIIICEGDATLITFAAAGNCTGNWEYRVNNGGTVVQAWSTTASFNAAPTTTTTYTVYARCSACTGTVVSETFDVNVVEEPTVTGNLVVCPGTSTTLTASGGFGPYEWYDAPGGNQLSATDTYTTPALSSDATYYAQATGTVAGAGGSILITECGLEGFAGNGSADYLEISNLYTTAVNTTGWVAAVSNSYGVINSVNTILWNLPNSFSPCSVVSRNDISGDPNYWGNNILWNPGANTTYKSWAIIIDDVGNVVDFVAWGWTAAELAGFNPTINGFNITLGAEWTGNGCDATCGVAGGPALSIQRVGNNDNNNLGDFVCQASTPDVVNPGLVCGWPSGVTCPYPTTVVVDTPPTASNPAPIAVECAAPAPDPSVVTDETDDFTANPTVTWLSDVSDNNTCPETITRTYRVSDACGSYVDVAQTITINDITNPVFAAPPGNVTVECIGDVPAMTNLGWTDNCDGSGSVAGSDGSLTGGTCGGTITRTWTYTDACGNNATVTQTITVNDTQVPIFAVPPADVTVECIGDVPAMTDLGWTDNCDGAGMVTGTDAAIVGGNCGGTITRTWTYTDACGNNATATQTITVDDTQAPVMAAAPADVTVECIGDVPAMTDLGWTDNCDGAGMVTGTDAAIVGGNCGGTITRTWTYTDACGNTSTTTQTITVDDTQAPVMAVPPADITVECSGDVPAMTDLGWTDNCDGSGMVTGTDSPMPANLCGGTITRTWTYTDACGNTATVTQTITIDDTTPPTASNPLPQVGTPPPFDPLQVTDEADNCGVPTVTDGGDVSDGGTCPEIITRTYIITDACGNSITVEQTFTIGDAILPTASNPLPMNVECAADVLGPDPLVVTDEADNGTTPVVTWESDVSDNNTCPEVITRTYRVTDDCGNFIFVTQTITIQDVTAPVFAAPPADVTVECIGDVPAMTDLGWTDNCDGAGMVTGTDAAIVGGNCGGTITRTWTYTDACGNNATVTQTITVDDTQAPVMAATPADVTVECIGDVPAMTDLGWTDNCDGAGMVTGTDAAIVGGNCGGTITRTWTYTDACGNTSTTTQTITVDDTQAPVMAAPPADITVECPGDVPAMTDLGWTDNCDGAGMVTGADSPMPANLCGGTITRTWTYTDACGNTATVTQTITIDDTTPPTASNPATTTVPGGSAPAVDPLVVIDEADNCTTNPVVAFVSESSDGNPCPETITRIYSVTDDCGNTINVTHTILITDPFLPTASNPLPINVECAANVPGPDPLVVTDEADNQGVPTVAWVSDVSDNNTCPEVITRTYSVTDVCGGQILVTQTITIQDITVPVFAAPPADVTVECIGDVPAMTDLGWTDNCDGAGMVTGTDAAIVGGNCGGTITRTWTYTDACGNNATVTQTITVDDTQAPVMAAAPADVTVECIGDVPAMTDLGWTDNCDGAGMVTGTDAAIVGGTCGGTITRTWTYTDACGNTSTTTQTITVDDTQAPVMAVPPADITVECSGDVPAMTDLGWTDNCDGSGMVTGTDSPIPANLCGGTITRTWTYTDACGNTATVTQTITIDDTTPPTASNPVTTTVPGGPAPAVDPLVVIDEADNCTTNPVVAFVSESSDGNPCPETITRIYSVTDDCGNTINVTHTILITDPILPTASNPLPINVECAADVPGTNPLVVTDEADNQGVPTVTWTSDVSDNNSCPETITRTYTVTDVCGNAIDVYQTITIEDITAPVMAVAPADVTVECIGDVPAMIDLGWTDNCDGAGMVTGTDAAIVGGNCGGTITRTWTYTDACGNTSTATQTITVDDTQVPVLAAAPADVTVECIGDVPAMTDLGWTDNCDGAGMVTGTDATIVGGNCGGTITRTWTYTDACGNTSTATQTITVNDTQAPVMDVPPTNITVECIGDVPAMIDLGWTDNCDGVGTVTGTDAPIVGGNCGGTITRTWTYTDACGNNATVTQTITVDDTTPPTASNPFPISVPGAMDVPAPDPTVVIDEADNCTLTPVVAWVSDVSDGNVCNLEEITRTYSVTDDCGNQILVTQQIVILATYPPVDAGPDDLICEGETITLTAGNPWGVPISWSPSNPPVDGQPFAPTQTTTYIVTADNLGCVSTDDVTITVEPLPVSDFVADTTAGCAPFTVNFTNLSVGSSALTDCVWEINNETLTGCNTVGYTFENGGLYDVTLTTTTVNGCSGSITYEDLIYVEEIPLAAFTASPTMVSTMDTEVEFTNNSVGATDYMWNFGDESANSTQENPTHSFPDEETAGYVVELIAFSEQGLCSDTAWQTINVQEELIFYMPNTFTPDGDSYNEFFRPVFTSGYDPYDFTLFVFNRWGEIIWESHDASIGWDGTYNGSIVPQGVYSWKIEFKTSATDERMMVTGHVNLLK